MRRLRNDETIRAGDAWEVEGSNWLFDVYPHNVGRTVSQARAGREDGDQIQWFRLSEHEPCFDCGAGPLLREDTRNDGYDTYLQCENGCGEVYDGTNDAMDLLCQWDDDQRIRQIQYENEVG